MKPDRSIVRKLNIHYAVAFAVYFGAFCMVRSFISVYLLDRGFTYSQVGLVTGIHIFCAAVIQPNFSQILDRFPGLNLRRFVAICCIPSVICSSLTFLLPAKLYIYLLIYVFLGFFEIGLQSLMVSVGMEYVNGGIPINEGLSRGVGSVGYALFNIVLGTLIVRLGSSVSQILNIVLMVLLAILMLMMPAPASLNGTQTEKRENAAGHSENILTFLRNNSTFAIFSLSVIFLFFGHCIVNTYMPNVIAQFGLGTDFTGWMNAIAASLELIPMMFYLRISRKIHPMSMLRISAVFFTVKLLTTTLARSGAMIAVAQTMQMVAYALFIMASIYFTNQAVKPENRVMAQGLVVGANEIGFMIGGFLGGLILDAADIRTLLWIGVAVSLLGSILMLGAIRKFGSERQISDSITAD